VKRRSLTTRGLKEDISIEPHLIRVKEKRKDEVISRREFSQIEKEYGIIS